MPITSISSDQQAQTIVVVGDYPVSVQRLWNAYADPRSIESFWGPPQWPATFERHDFFEGGRSQYYMTGPDGETSAGYWQFVHIEPLQSFTVIDGFAQDDGSPKLDTPTIEMEYYFEETDTGSRLVTTSHFASAEDLNELLQMGMLEGTESAMGQLDQVLADNAFAFAQPTLVQHLTDVKVRISRVVALNQTQVWRAHNNADDIRQWMLGPEGWRMTTCEPARTIGEGFHYEWVDLNGENGFGFEGELHESTPQSRMVTTERMIGVPGEGALNELTLTELAGGTLISTVITYPNAEVADAVLSTGMADGMELSYARMERVLQGVDD